MMNKIFCIGLNKTGTTSLHQAFEILGLKSVHFVDDKGNNIKDIIQENYLAGNDILKGLEGYDAFTDWDNSRNSVEIFKEFDKQYPESKFILNTRELNSWLDSRENHVKRNQATKEKNPDADITWLEVDREGWEMQFRSHHDEVYKYFDGRNDDLLVIDVTNGDGWELLCPFLGVERPKVPFPKRNVAPQNKSRLRKFLIKIYRHLPDGIKRKIAKAVLRE